MSNIIITGPNGFVGSNLLDYFSAKHVLSGISRAGSSHEKLVSTSWNELNVGALKNADVIIHLAGKAHDLQKTANDEEYFHVNYGKTKQLFDLFLASDCKDFIYISSVKAVADGVDGILKEDAIPAPKTPYGQSKLQAEEYLLSQTLPVNKRLFILRPCMIHGPGNKGNLNLLYNVVKKGIPYPLGAFKNTRSFLSIANLLYVFERLIGDASIPGGIYNVADDIPLPTTEVINTIAQVSGLKPKIWNIPQGFIVNLAKLGSVLHLPLNTERLKKLTESYVVSNEKIKIALAIKHFPVSSKEGLAQTIKSFHSK